MLPLKESFWKKLPLQSLPLPWFRLRPNYREGTQPPHQEKTGLKIYWKFSSVLSLSLVPLFATPWTAACQASLSITNSQSLLKLMSIELVMPSNHLILWHPLLPPSIFSTTRVFPNESVLHIRWPKDCSTSFSISQSFQWVIRTDFLQDLLVGSPWSPRDSQESSPTPQSKSINSLALSFLYSPTLTSIHDYWKNHSFD